MNSKVSVSDITITDLSPKITNKALEKFIPKTLLPQHVEFTISGVSNAVANGIRRTIACELLVSALYAEYEDMTTNDMFIIPEMILKRLRMIPLDQSCPLDALFELNVTNTTDSIRDVKSSEIRIVNGGKGTPERPSLKRLPFNETFTLFTLEPGKSAKINNIGIHQAYGFNEGDCMHVIAINCASVALDQKPINMYAPEDDQLPSSLSNPRVWRIRFNTNGTMPPAGIIAAACDNIIARVQSVHNLLYSIQNVGNTYVLTVNGESDTIGNLFMRTINDLYPDIHTAVYNVGSDALTIRIHCDEDITSIYSSAIKYIVKTYTDIKNFL